MQKLQNIVIILYLCSSLNVLSQSETDSTSYNYNSSKIYYGGSLSLTYGRHYDMIDLSPSIGYFVLPRFLTGVGLSYAYYGYEYEQNKKEYYLDDNYFGANIFVRYYLRSRRYSIFNNMFVDGTFEMLSSNIKSDNDKDAQGNSSYLVPMVGVGYRNRISNRFAFNIMISVTLTDAKSSPYRNPLIRFGFEF